MSYFGETKLETIIARLILIPVVEKHDMVQRKYHLNVTPESLRSAGNLIDHKANKIQDKDIIDYAPNIFTYNLQPDLAIGIDNGWKQRRFSFMLELHHLDRDSMTGSINGKSIEYIQGYTNYDGASRKRDNYTGKDLVIMDERMVFYINSVIGIREIPIPGTDSVTHSLMFKFNLMTNPHSNNEELMLDKEAFKVLRPVDIASDFMLREQLDPSIPTSNFTNVIDSNMIIESKHDNKNNLKQVSSILNSAYNAKVNSEYLNDRASLFSHMSSNLREPSIADVNFMTDLSYEYGSYSTTFDAKFLIFKDKYLSEKSTLLPDTIDTPINTDKDSLILFSNDTEYVGRTAEEARLANLVSEVLVPMIFSKNLSSFSFSLTTELGFHEPIFTYMSSSSFIPIVNANKMILVSALEELIIDTLLPQLTKGNRQLISLMCYINLLGQSRVAISVNNGPLIPFAIPTYANALYDSNIVRGQHRIDTEINSWGQAINLIF